MNRGLDCSTIATPYAGKIAAAGFSAVGRYLKSLSRAEVAALHAAGLDVWLIFEYAATRALEGAAAGTQDGTRAVGQADALGAPVNCAIYATVDTDTSATPAVAAYLATFGAAISPRRLGVYADGSVLAAAKPALAIPWLAGALGWAGSRDYDAANGWAMKQGVTIRAAGTGSWAGFHWPALPFDYDPNVIAKDDIGAWSSGVTPAPAPHIVIPSALDMQIQLKAEGLYAGALDGDKPGGWGPQSQAALVAYYNRK